MEPPVGFVAATCGGGRRHRGELAEGVWKGGKPVCCLLLWRQYLFFFSMGTGFFFWRWCLVLCHTFVLVEMVPPQRYQAGRRILHQKDSGVTLHFSDDDEEGSGVDRDCHEKGGFKRSALVMKDMRCDEAAAQGMCRPAAAR